jgi:tetratricopeptide (TPR) repeat protein
MSEGAAALLKEEIEFGRKASESQGKAKQFEIIAKVKRLESEGLISGVSRGSAELWEEELGAEEGEGVLEYIIKAAQKALEQQSSGQENSSTENESSDEAAFKFYEQGLAAYKEQNYDVAIKNFNQSLKYNPGVWQTHQYVGACYLAIGDEANAKKSYSKSLELNPENSELREWLMTH